MVDCTDTAFFDSHGIKMDRIIDEGDYGYIYLVYSTKHQKNFALEKIHEECFRDSDLKKIEIIFPDSSIQVYKYYRYQKFVYILMEFCPSEFYFHNSKKISLNSDQMKKYCYEILCSIKMFHDRGISHTDLKPSNFMIDQNGRVKLCQASFASLYEHNTHHIDYKDYMLFMSPEVLKQKAYDPFKADIWAVGIIFYYIILHIHPFFADNFKALIKLVNDGIFPIFAIKDPEFRDVIIRCLDYCEETRATVDELLNLPYFVSYATTKKPIRERQIATRSHSAIVQNKFLQNLTEISKSRISRVPLTRRLAKTIGCKKD